MPYFFKLLQGTYSFYTWPSAPALAWYLWENRTEIYKKRILEIGSGTSLPGILAAKCGAYVTLSDSASLPKSLKHLERCCAVNNLTLNDRIRVIGLTWGLFLTDCSDLGPIDFILGSDCFYDPLLFEDILVTVSYLLRRNPGARFLFSYQERSSDWSIEHLLLKWQLRCKVINISNLIKHVGISLTELIGNHCIHLFEITLQSDDSR